nr:MAG: putative RNA-dependent RNA polymerase [Mitoviridae sp.]
MGYVPSQERIEEFGVRKHLGTRSPYLESNMQPTSSDMVRVGSVCYNYYIPMKLYLTNLLKTIKERATEAHYLVLAQINGLQDVASFKRGMSPVRGTKMWIEESTSQYLASYSPLRHIRRAKLAYSDAKSGRLREFGRFAKIVSWIIGNKALYAHFHHFLLRVEQMLIRNGSTYTFKYMKECLRLAVRALAGSPEVATNYNPGDIRVRRDSYGIPTILPLSLRLILHAYIINVDVPTREETHPDADQMEGWDPISYGVANPRVQLYNQRNIVGVLTLLSIFRVFATKVEPTLSTIVKPFNGVVRTFNSELVHKALAVMVSKVERSSKFDFTTGGTIVIKKYIKGKTPLLSIGEFSPHISTKSGPNGSFSTWSASLDALAFVHEPSKLVALTRWMYSQGAYGWIGLLYLIIILYGPIYLFFYGLNEISFWFRGLLSRVGGSGLYYRLEWLSLPRSLQPIIGPGHHERTKLYLGKLGVVYDQAGKARVVASANWWIQSALKGLHSSIFKLLKTLPKDGTMDQNAAFDLFISNVDKTSKMSGFDLSAATDRLPIDLQKIVLDSCGVNGSLWSELMNVTYVAPFENKENLTEVEYAVGQPMGAYSSWAMLALTHHMIVNLAALLTGQDKLGVNYAVLGDDMVINNDLVAEKYVELMTDLGLEISMGKSVISNRFTEFAKKLRGPGIDFSPIGAGAILASSRSGLMIPQVFLSAIGNVITSPEEILDRLKDFPSGLVSRHQAAGYLTIVLWQLFGPSSPLVRLSSVNFGRLVSDMLEFVPGVPSGGYSFEHIKDSMGNLFTRQIRTNVALSYKPLQLFIMNSLWMVVSGSPLMRVLETLMKPFNPGFWIYLDFAIKAPFKLDNHWDEVYSSFPPIPPYGDSGFGYFRAKEIMRILSQNSPELGALTLDLTKKELKARAKYLMDLRKDMKDRYDLSQLFASPERSHMRWYEFD